MATNYARASYTEVIDLQTVNGKCSIVGIHTPTGRMPYEKLKGFFLQYKKYRYKGISKMVMCPAANLPVDPLGLTGINGTTDLMDPRDALNPVMFHGCHGEAINQIVDRLYMNNGQSSATGIANPSVGYLSNSADLKEFDLPGGTPGVVPPAERAYYNFLTDPRWKKFGIQSMVKLQKLHPLVWKVARSMPMLPNTGGTSNYGTGVIRYQADSLSNGIPNTTTPGSNDAVLGPSYPQGEVPTIPGFGDGVEVNTRAFVQEFTNGVTRMGWLPTTSFGREGLGITVLPKIFMGVLVLPPAYNVEQFFRLSIRHVFEFAGFTTNQDSLMPSLVEPNTGSDAPYFNWIKYTDAESGAKVEAVSNVDYGGTLDCLDASSTLISDGVN